VAAGRRSLVAANRVANEGPSVIWHAAGHWHLVLALALAGQPPAASRPSALVLEKPGAAVDGLPLVRLAALATCYLLLIADR
jgi:hypothetical protein